MTSRTSAAANARAEAIRLGLQQTGVIYAKAVELEDWRTLGCQALRQWARNEFGPDRFSPKARKEIVGLLTDQGLTQRQIADATGANQSTVARDQAEQPGDANASQEDTQSNNTRQQRSARQREQNKRRTPPPQPQPPAEEKEPVMKTRGRQGDTEGAMAEIRRRMRADAPVKRQEIAKLFHVSEVFVRQAMASLEAAQELPAGPKGRAKNWNGKTTPTRQRELKGRKKTEAEAYLELTKVCGVIAQLCGILENLRMEDYTPEEVSIWYVSDLLDDLISLGTWLDRATPAVQRWLGDADVRQKIETLRNVTGRTPEEAKTFLARAAKLERQLGLRLTAMLAEGNVPL